MRIRFRSAATVALICLLAMPASAAASRSFGPSGVLQAIKRFVIRVASRVSPPGGNPVQCCTTDEPTTTTTTSDGTTETP